MKSIVFLLHLIFLNNTTLYGMDHITNRIDQLIAQYDSYFILPQLTNKFSSFLEQDDLSYLTADDSPLLDIDLYRKFPEALPLLLAKKADPNIIGQDQCTPLGLAIHATTQDQSDTAQNAAIALLNAGADPNKKHKATRYYMVEEPPLLTAIHFGKKKIVQALIEYGAELDRDALLSTLSRVLTIRDRPAKVAILLRSGANPLSSVNGRDILFFMKEYTTHFPLDGSDNDYKKIGRALVRYKILNARFNRNTIGLPPEVIAHILRFVDYGLDKTQ